MPRIGFVRFRCAQKDVSKASTTRRVARFTAVTLGVIVGVPLVAFPALADYSPTPRTATWSATDGRVYSIERIADTIYIGGSFTTLRNPTGTATVARSRLAAFDAITGSLLLWNPGANNDVRALKASSDGTGLFVGGIFTTIAGVNRNRLAEVNTSTGALVTSFSVNASASVFSVERIGSRVFFGGTFTSVNGAAHARIAAVAEATGVLVPGWNGSASATVNKILAAPDEARIFLGGQFHTLSGQSRDFIGALNYADGAATAWRPPIPCTDTQNPCYVLDLAADLGKVYAGAGGPGGRVVAYDIANGSRQWAAYGDGDVQAVAVDGSTVYAGGHFDVQFAQQSRAGLVALDSSTGGLLDFGPHLYNGLGVWDILAGPDYLRVGGGFTRIETNTARMRYAEFPAIAAPPDNTAPSVPGNLRTLNVSDTIANLAWGASADDNVVSGYRLWRDGQPLVTLGVTNYSDRGLTPATAYTYQVQATDPAGNWSNLSAPVTVVTAPPSTSLVKAGSTWRYYSQGGDQGTTWVDPSFNDSTWSSGDAQLGYGDGDEYTVISPLGLTHYFRQKFDVNDLGNISALTLRLLRDDGAIVYVNGTEVMRSNMPTGAVNYLTPASTEITGSAENTFYTQSVPVNVLTSGTNTVAVEVHNRTGSTDVSFDLELVPTISGPADNVDPSQPQNLHTSSVTSNSVGLGWDASTDNIGVTGYRITRNGAVAATVSALSWTDTGRTPGATYTYTVTALDGANNASLASDPVTVTLPQPPGALLGTGDVWRYRTATSAPPVDWATTGFDDSTWPSGPSQLGFGDGDEATVITKGALSFYFRRSISVADPSIFTTLNFSLLRDDGAVVYVNGTEVTRSNMPAGTISYSTLASSNVSGAAESTYTNFTAPASLLVAGTNVIAVEVHQDAASSSDISMDLRLTGS
jgi:trimeric autotransporter adhesin